MTRNKVRTQQEILNERMRDPEFAAEYDRRRAEMEHGRDMTETKIEAELLIGKPFMDHAMAEMEDSGDPGFSGWGRSHMSAQAIERQRINNTIRSNWRAPGEDSLSDQILAEPLPDVGKTFGHKEAGLLQLIATGEGGWVLRIRGVDYGLGRRVGRRERDGDVLKPSQRTLNAAAERALKEGPESPPDAVMFTGDGEMTVAEYMRLNKLV